MYLKMKSNSRLSSMIIQFINSSYLILPFQIALYQYQYLIMIAYYVRRTLAGFANVKNIDNKGTATLRKQNKHEFKIWVHKIHNLDYFAQVIEKNHSLSQTNRLLHGLLTGGSGINKNNFESIFKKYCYYVEHIPRREGYAEQSLTEKLKFLSKTTEIYQKYGKLASKHMIKTFNHVSDSLISRLKQKLQNEESIQQILNAILSVARYNKNKAIACFKSIEAKLANQRRLKQINKEIALSFIDLMPKIGIYNRLILQTCIDTLINQIDYISFQDISRILYCLASSHYPINRNFMVKIIGKVDKYFHQKIDYKTGKSISKNQYERRSDLNVLSSLSMIQTSMNLASAYLPELTELYQKQIYQIGVNNLSKLSDKDLEKYCSFLRRTCYYDQNLLKKLAAQVMRRNVIQLQSLQIQHFKQNSLEMKISDQLQNKYNQISLNTLCATIHTFSVFNYRNQPFISYFINILQISCNTKRITKKEVMQESSLEIAQQGKSKLLLFEAIKIKHYSRVIWSLCVLGRKEELAKVYKIFQQFFKGELVNNGEMSEVYNMINIYYCYLLLKVYFPTKNLSFQKLIQRLESKHLLTTVSKTHHQIYSVFIEVGIPSLKQHNISNMMCDIFVPRYISLDGKYYVQNIVIDLHGPHHFMRNCHAVKGGSALKKKILNSQGYLYQYVGFDQWELASNKRKFVLNLMENIVVKYGKPFKNNSQKIEAPKQSYIQSGDGKKNNQLINISTQDNDDQYNDNKMTSKIQYSRKRGRHVRTNSLKLNQSLNSK